MASEPAGLDQSLYGVAVRVSPMLGVSLLSLTLLSSICPAPNTGPGMKLALMPEPSETDGP